MNGLMRFTGNRLPYSRCRRAFVGVRHSLVKCLLSRREKPGMKSNKTHNSPQMVFQRWCAGNAQPVLP